MIKKENILFLILLHGVNFYKIRFPINIKNLIRNKDYYDDYHLIIQCNETIWNEILKSLKDKNYLCILSFNY